MDNPEQVRLALLVLGALTAAYGAFRTIRRVVHFFDAIEHAASDLTQAIRAVNHHLTENGGRLEKPLTNEEAKSATLMDLLLDIRASLHNLTTGQGKHDKAAEARVDRIIEGVKAAHQP